MFSIRELQYMEKQGRPLFGGHLKRKQPVTDTSMKETLDAGLIRQMGEDGYVLTDWGKEVITKNVCPMCRHEL